VYGKNLLDRFIRPMRQKKGLNTEWFQKALAETRRIQRQFRLAQCLTEPIRRSLEYQAIGRKLLVPRPIGTLGVEERSVGH